MFRGGRQVFQVGHAPSGPTVIRPLVLGTIESNSRLQWLSTISSNYHGTQRVMTDSAPSPTSIALNLWHAGRSTFGYKPNVKSWVLVEAFGEPEIT